MKILLLEDNRDLAESLGDYLEAMDCQMDYAYSGISALELAQREQFEVLVLDIAMPGMNGLTVCRKLRQEHKIATPILFLTARDTLNDKLEGFEAGCDDYLVKPFSPEELFYRLKSLCARGGRKDIGVQICGEFEIDYTRKTVSHGGQSVLLNETHFQILSLLAKNAPNCVSRETIEQVVWGDNPPQSDALRTHIYRLRNLVDKAFNKSLITTVHNRGFRLNV